jgi:hypothetical protein
LFFPHDFKHEEDHDFVDDEVALTVIKIVPLLVCTTAMDRYALKVGVAKDDGMWLLMRAHRRNGNGAIRWRVEIQFPPVVLRCSYTLSSSKCSC